MIPIDFSILGMAGDFDFVLKIFFVLAVIAFIKQRITNNKLSLVIITLAIVAMVFLYWPIFRLAYILYTVLAMGVASVLVDFFFVSAGGSPEEIMNRKSNTPGSPGGAEEAARRNAQKRAIGRRPGM